MIRSFYNIIFFLALQAFFTMPLIAQVNVNSSKEYRLETADKLFEAGSYYNALDHYKVLHEKQPDNNYIINRLAETSFLARDYENAEKWYKKLVYPGTAEYPMARFNYARMLKLNGKYEVAKAEFQFVINDPATDLSTKKIAQREVKSSEFAIQQVQKPEKVLISNPGKLINSAYTEFAPFPIGNNELLFSSLRSDSVIILQKEKDKDKEENLARVYTSQKKDIIWRKPAMLPSAINEFSAAHTGNGSYNADKTKFYFTVCKDDEITAGYNVKCEIYVSEVKNEVFQPAQKLGLNTPGHTNSHPRSVTGANGREILYFTSDRPGGAGNLDIWYAVNNNGQFSAPVNAGGTINTGGNEITPYYNTGEKALYFSSDYHTGFGGYDIFKSTGSENKFTFPVNIGSPLNSSVDDMYYINESDNTGYLVSNRRGSIALTSATCCDDIFRFEKQIISEDSIILALNGFVLENGDTTRTPITGATIQLFQVIDGKKNVVASALSNKDSLYFFKLKRGEDFKINAFKKGYFPGPNQMINTRNIVKSDTLRADIDLFLEKILLNKAYSLKNIYYDFDKATLRPESKTTLDSLYTILSEQPDLVIELASHTDSRGTGEYNITLSQARAESVIKYLIEKGIPARRLVAKGYGESLPVAPNQLPNGKDNPEGRQLNRRTEFRVVGGL